MAVATATRDEILTHYLERHKELSKRLDNYARADTYGYPYTGTQDELRAVEIAIASIVGAAAGFDDGVT